MPPVALFSLSRGLPPLFLLLLQEALDTLTAGVFPTELSFLCAPTQHPLSSRSHADGTGGWGGGVESGVSDPHDPTLRESTVWG